MVKRKNVATAVPSKKAKVVQPEPESSEDEQIYDNMIDSDGNGDEDDDDEDEGDYIEGEDDGQFAGSDNEDDDEDMEEEQDVFMAAAEAAATAKDPHSSVKNSSLYKAPTADEIQGLQESQELFKSNIFKLQIEELLKEVQVDYTKTSHLEAALRQLKEIFDGLPDQKEKTLAEIKASMKKNSIQIPFPSPQPPSDIQYKFAFKAPTAMHLVGSFPLKTIAKTKDIWNVDVAVEMPEELFQEKDHMNYRYFYKRAYYLSMLAAAIQSKKSGMSNFKLEFHCLDGDQRRPILILSPPGDKSKLDFAKLKCQIRILPYIPSTFFPAQRLAPGRNNVRSTTDNVDNTPTPHYNSALQQDTAFTSHLAFLYQHSKACAAFKDACVLLKIWARQRGLLRQTNEGLNGFVLEMLMAYLLQGGGPNAGRKLANGFSSYQLVKGTIDFLAKHDFTASPVFMGRDNTSAEFAPDEFVTHSEVVFVDPSGRINLAGQISKASLEEVQHEARLAMQFFSESNDDKFGALFLERVDNPLLRFDNIIRCKVPHNVAHSKRYTQQVALDHPSAFEYFTRSIAPLLKQGLTDRVFLVTCRYDPMAPWSLNSARPELSDSSYVTIGLLLNQEASTRLVDMGPAAEEQEAAQAFRELWGDRAELRRFKDGSILESVVWEAQGTEARHLIVGQMVAYLLKHHLHVPVDSVQYWAGQLNKYIQYHKNVPERLVDNEKAAAGGFQTVLTAFESLTKAIKTAEDLPLTVTHTNFASAAGRLSSTFLPYPRDLNSSANSYPDTAQYVEPMDVVIQFETSTKWPDNLKAIQRMKTAFYLRLAQKLKYKGMMATVVEETEEETIAQNGYMDVRVAPGFVFRCRIAYDREQALCEKVLTDRKASHALKEQHQQALDLYHHYFVKLPMHTFQMHALCHKHPALSQTIRLTKRWLSAHWLAPFIREEAAELLAAHVFIDTAPWAAPASGFTGFARVLNLLVSWDWKNEPLIVDMTGEMTLSQREEIRKNFLQTRKGIVSSSVGGVAGLAKTSEEHAAMFIATDKDLASKWWTWTSPSKMILGRLRSLAKASLGHLKAVTGSEPATTTTSTSLAPLFTTPTADYDVVLELDPSVCTRYAQSLRPQQELLVTKGDKYKNLGSFQKSAFGEEILVGFDSATLYLEELQRSFGDIALFFHDTYGGTQIGVLWNPIALTPKAWKVNQGYNNKPADVDEHGGLVGAAAAQQKQSNGKTKQKDQNKMMLVPNIEALLGEMARLGHGIVQGVHVNREFKP
ncbi:hypothetical protein DFQ26_008167 [Actinomortierella ambigua]|nr:hypothetical protein DFQ26_008167 [Actinomortierella ambigua]